MVQEDYNYPEIAPNVAKNWRIHEHTVYPYQLWSAVRPMSSLTVE